MALKEINPANVSGKSDAERKRIPMSVPVLRRACGTSGGVTMTEALNILEQYSTVPAYGRPLPVARNCTWPARRSSKGPV